MKSDGTKKSAAGTESAAITPDCVIVFQFSSQGQCDIRNDLTVLEQLGRDKALFVHRCLETTLPYLQGCLENPSVIIGRSIRLRISPACQGTIHLMSHELLMNLALLEYPAKERIVREHFLIVCFLEVLYHLFNSHLHISQVRYSSFLFLSRNMNLLDAALDQMPAFAHTPELESYCTSLTQMDALLLLERFWKWLDQTGGTQEVVRSVEAGAAVNKKTVRHILSHFVSLFEQTEKPPSSSRARMLLSFRQVYADAGCLILVYELRNQVLQAIRLCPQDYRDAFSCQAACQSIGSGGVRTEIFYDHGPYIRSWISRLKTYSLEPAINQLAGMLTSGHLHTVNAAIDELDWRIRRKQHAHESQRLLYAALYYWHHANKGISRSVCFRVSKILEDILTERPALFPHGRVNRSYFRGETPTIRIEVDKPPRTLTRNIQARIQWSVNGRRQKPISMSLSAECSADSRIGFESALPSKTGWIHYSVQVSWNAGKTWEFEKFDENSHGLLKRVADERGHRILSLYADCFNLKLDAGLHPVRDETGAFVYGTFDDLADQLESIRNEGYTRIYPLGALELGWAGEAGPDPSVFSVWDGRTVRRDLGGMEGLLRLKQRADQLGMKILLCMLSHFSRAYHSWPYSLPAFIIGTDGRLTRRAGWDGEWDEWLDSFMVNMRDLDNVEYLVNIAKELTDLGFGLRIDVGHGFDTVFPVNPSLSTKPKLFGEVTLKGFEPVDLRGTNEPNIPLLYICYRVQKAVPGALVAYSEQWHGNEVRMIKSATIPYNALIKNLEHIRNGQNIESPLGLNNNYDYLNRILKRYGGQTLSLFNSHDEESPASNYQNMIWPAAAMLVFGSYGPLMYHISRLPGAEFGAFSRRFDMAYTECWKHWVNNRFNHPWQDEDTARQSILSHYPYLRGFGTYLRALYAFADEHPVLTKGTLTAIKTGNSRIAAFVRSYQKQKYLCVFNFPNAVLEGQQAVARPFNFRLRSAADGSPVEGISADEFYELRQRYNNVEGKMRWNKGEYWDGHELLELGFGGALDAVSTAVYEIVSREQTVPEKQVLFDSFRRFFRYGKEDRTRHCYAARVFIECCGQKPDFERFGDLFRMLTGWLLEGDEYGISAMGCLFSQISDRQPDIRPVILEFLTRIAVNKNQRFEKDHRRAAADILQSINIGTIVLVSPESRFSGAAGGVGIYITDIADVLSELGFHVILVTPLYECNRKYIHDHYKPVFEGHQFSIRFPEFHDHSQMETVGSTVEVVNILRSTLARRKYGKRSRIEILYLENGKYLSSPYSGTTAEDKIRHARVLSQGALEALRCYNYYPSIIQTNEWPSWLVAAYLNTWPEFRNDPHFAQTRVGSMMHNPHPSYSIILNEANPVKRNYYCHVLGIDPHLHYDLAVNRFGKNGHEIDLTHTMLKSSHFIGTVSRAMKERMMRETWLFGHIYEFAEKHRAGMFFARRNGFNMAARQRFWFGSKKSMVETYQPAARKRLFYKYYAAKKTAKLDLQNDPHIHLTADSETSDHVIFGMLHRISKQKGFELLADWKVFCDAANQYVRFEPWNMNGPTLLEHFLSTDPRIQFAICGRVEDSMDGRRFDAHFRRIAARPDMAGRFAYYPEGNLPPSLYRNLYIGCQYFVMPSGGEVGEPCGISQQEAHAGGTPVIAHHQDGLQHTVSDADFGDTKNPSNGIKFSGFNGQTFLDALNDAVSVYYTGKRTLYRNPDASPKTMDYDEMVYNAFCRDHRWIRPLRDYIDMYAKVQQIDIPPHLDALRLTVEAADAADSDLGDVIVRYGLTGSQAAAALIEAMASPVSSLRQAAARTLVRFVKHLDGTFGDDVRTHLRDMRSCSNKTQAKLIHWVLNSLD